MIRLLEGLPDHVVAAEATGTITDSDYADVLIPAVEAAGERGRLRLLFVLGEGFEGYDAHAALDDARMGLAHWGDFDRIALVTNHGAYRAVAKGFGFLMPGEVRVYALADRGDAITWVGEPPDDGG